MKEQGIDQMGRRQLRFTDEVPDGSSPAISAGADGKVHSDLRYNGVPGFQSGC